MARGSNWIDHALADDHHAAKGGSHRSTPAILLQSLPVTRDLAGQLLPVGDPAYKHREDLIDALLCACTASLWARRGFDRCQVLGLPATPKGDPAAHDDRPRPARNSDDNRYLNPHYQRRKSVP